MSAEEYLQDIGLENIVGEEFFNDEDKSWYDVQGLMEAYHKSELEKLIMSEEEIEARTDSYQSDEWHPNRNIYLEGRREGFLEGFLDGTTEYNNRIKAILK